MRRMRQRLRIIEIIPNIRLGETFALRELNPAAKVIIGIKITGERLEVREE